MQAIDEHDQGSGMRGDLSLVIETLREEIRSEFDKVRGELRELIDQIAAPPALHRNKPGPKPKIRVPEEPALVAPTPPPPPPPPQTLENRIEAALTRESLGTEKLAKAIGEEVEKLEVTLRDLRARRQIYNVGIGENPLWTWKIGDHTDTQVLISVVQRLISERPMGTRELADATGARMSRVGGALIAIQRSGANVVNMGVGHAGRWFLISDHVKDAKYSPKPTNVVKKKRRGPLSGGGSSGAP